MAKSKNVDKMSIAIGQNSFHTKSCQDWDNIEEIVFKRDHSLDHLKGKKRKQGKVE